MPYSEFGIIVTKRNIIFYRVALKILAQKEIHITDQPFRRN
jgi:hypothetical protein